MQLCCTPDFSYAPSALKADFLFLGVFMGFWIKKHCGNKQFYIVYKNMVDFTKVLCYNVYNSFKAILCRAVGRFLGGVTSMNGWLAVCCCKSI